MAFKSHAYLLKHMIIRYNLFSLLWAGLIAFITLMPGSDLPKLTIDLIIPIDKLTHIFIFAVQAFLLIIGLTKQFTFPKLSTHAIWVAFCITIGYGALIELLQGLTPDRSPELWDMLANTCGAGAGVLLFYIIYKL